MNLIQQKRHKAYSNLKKYFDEYGVRLSAAFPALGEARLEFNNRFRELGKCIAAIDKTDSSTSLNNQRFKEDCMGGVWKLVLELKTYYNKINDKSGMEMVNISRSKLKRMNVNSFFIFWQSLMNVYEEGKYKPVELNSNEMNMLKLQYIEMRDRLQDIKENATERKLAWTDLNTMQGSMDFFLKYCVATIIDKAGPAFNTEKLKFNKIFNAGIPSPESGKPAKAGYLAAGEIIVIDKIPFRDNLTLVVSNPGKTTIRASRSTNKTGIQGRPLLIKPGKVRRRIGRRLGVNGKYILIQNLGEEEGNFEVWLKE